MATFGKIQRLNQVRSSRTKENSNITIVDFEDPEVALKLIEKGKINVLGAPVECRVHLEQKEIELVFKGENLYFHND